MNAHLVWNSALYFTGTNEKAQKTEFDSSITAGAINTAASPMEIVLQAAAACTAMDIVSILQKKRRTVSAFSIDLTSERAEQHPKVFTKIAMAIHLTSPDATEQELVRSIELSQTTYCSVSIMLKRSGCDITWHAKLSRPSARV
ncbi:MAG: OsmC family protein [Rhabdochlamydiaceae bacterium]